MQFNFIAGIALGMLAALFINVGKGVQKQKVHVLREGRAMFHHPHRRDFLIWLLGLGMTACAMVPYSLGLMLSESPSAISAMTGVGLIGLAIYAVRVIGERFGPRDFVGITLVIVGTSLLSYVGAASEQATREVVGSRILLVFATFVLIATAVCLLALKVRAIHSLAFGASAGACLGFALTLADVALVRAGGSFLGQLSNPYPYIALGVGIMAMVLTQLGFFRGRALEVVPVFNSSAILTPLVLEAVLYGIHPNLLKVLLILVIVAGVVCLSLGAAAKVSE